MPSERPCKHCKQLKQNHRALVYYCDVDKLPLQFQEMYYNCRGDMVIPKYTEIGNLEYLEWLSTTTR
jgi:hypothetical protein